MTHEETRELKGVLNPSSTIEGRTGPNGALQIQADNFKETRNNTVQMSKEVKQSIEETDRNIEEIKRKKEDEEFEEFWDFVKELDHMSIRRIQQVEELRALHRREYAPYGMMNNFQYIITLPKATDITVAQNSSTVGTYSLGNLELEYETIENDGLPSEVSSSYGVGRSLAYKHRTLMKTTVWDKATVLVNENVNFPRKSMRAIVYLFSKTTSPTDSEEYLFPNIEKVKVTMEGVPNAVYSQASYLMQSNLTEYFKAISAKRVPKKRLAHSTFHPPSPKD